MFELDGKHFKAAYGKDFLDHLISRSDEAFARIGQDMDDRMAFEDNKVVAIEGRVDLLRRDQFRSDQRINVVVARSAEEADGHVNERYFN